MIILENKDTADVHGAHVVARKSSLQRVIITHRRDLNLFRRERAPNHVVDVHQYHWEL